MKTIYRMRGDVSKFNVLKKYREEGLLKVEEVRLTTWKNGDPKYIFVVKKTDRHNMYDKVLKLLNQVNKDFNQNFGVIWVTSVSDIEVEHRIEFLG